MKRVREATPPSPPTNLPDIAVQFGAPFAIYHDWEGERYSRFLKIDTIAHYEVNWTDMKTLGLDERFRRALKHFGWEFYADRTIAARLELVREFYSTLTIAENRKSFSARLFDTEFTVKENHFNKICHLQSGGSTLDFEPRSKAHREWAEITGFERYESGNAPSVLIKDPILALLHRFMTITFSGQWEESKVFRSQLYAIHCFREQKSFWTFGMVLDVFQRIIDAKQPSRLYLGHIISTVAANLFPTEYEAFETENKVFPWDLDIRKLTDCKLIKKTKSGKKEVVTYKEWEERKAVQERLRQKGPAIQVNDDDIRERLNAVDSRVQGLEGAFARMEEAQQVRFAQQQAHEEWMRAWATSSGANYIPPPPPPQQD